MQLCTWAPFILYAECCLESCSTPSQMLMSVQRIAMDVVIMPLVMILMVATGVSACQDSREMDTTVQVRLTEWATRLSVSLVLYLQISMSVKH